MRVCFLGTYERNYPRNQILLKAMQRAGITVIECHAPLWESKTHKTGEFKNPFKLLLLAFRFLFSYLILMFKYLSAPGHDLVLIGYPGQLDVIALAWVAKLRRKPLVFDAFLSIYDAVIDDRKLATEKSILSKLLFCLDQWSCKLSDRVILDTNQHIIYFSDTFKIPQNKFSRLWIGADELQFQPVVKKPMDGLYHVVFCGKFTPFHGVATILEAAKILEHEREISFDLIGTGQLFYEIRARVKEFNLANVRLSGWVDYEKVAGLTREADLCLGVFGNSPKTNRVIPNKIFEALAVKKPVVTARAQAIDELLTDMESIYLVTPGDPQELAHAIITLKNDAKLADKIAESGYRIFQEKANLTSLSHDILNIFQSVLN